MNTKMALLGLCFCVSAQANTWEQTDGTAAASKIWLVLDDFAYYIYEDVTIDLNLNEIYALNNDINNCTQFNSNPPLNNGNFTLVTDNQDIGIEGEIIYDFSRKALILTSQTNDLLCDGAFTFDRIYYGDFD